MTKDTVLYTGKRAVLYTALINHDPYDQFAWCQGWRFAICDYLTFELGINVPELTPGASGPDTEAFEYDELMATTPDIESLEYALAILDRFREWLRIANKDY